MQVAGYGNKWIREGKFDMSRITPEQIELSVNQSLERLGTDYVDLLQVSYSSVWQSMNKGKHAI